MKLVVRFGLGVFTAPHVPRRRAAFAQAKSLGLGLRFRSRKKESDTQATTATMMMMMTMPKTVVEQLYFVVAAGRGPMLRENA